MPTKNLLKLFTNHYDNNNHQTRHRNFAKMDRNISTAETIISKWSLCSSQIKLTPLFYDNREEAHKFCDAVQTLQRAMVYFSSKGNLKSPNSRSNYLAHAQTLMQSAMKRLEREFFQILSILDPGSEIAIEDLRTIAQTMIYAGYTKECLKIYNMLRRSIVDEALYLHEFKRSTPSQIQKLDWEDLDLKIQLWLSVSKTTIHTLLTGEQVLCDRIFEGFDLIRESCFAKITKEATLHFFTFPELIARSKFSLEKLFRVLDIYNTITYIWIDMESIFYFKSTETVREQVLSTFLKLGEVARFIIAEIEMMVRKDKSENVGSSSGIDPLARYTMNHIVSLADYEHTLTDIFIKFPVEKPLLDSRSISSSFSLDKSTLVSSQIASLISILLWKLDGKAKVYENDTLFFANNLEYIMKKVKVSKLRQILGEDWIVKQDLKISTFRSMTE